MNYKKTIKQAGLLLFSLLILASGVWAQSNTGTITGQVEDANGAAVPNATVTVTNVGTNETRTVQTNDDGFYEAASLSTGVYKVTATAAGFQETTVNEVRLAVGDRTRVDVNLAPGQVGGTVTVTADQTRVDTETSTVGDTINNARIQDAPVNGRDFTGLLATVPGSVQSTNQFQTSVNGIPSTFGGASVLVDGIDAGRVDLNGTSNVLGRIESRVNRVSMDSIQEIQVLEQNYSAQYGQALSAVINPITKSGTNEFHGSVFEFFRNEALDANDFFNNAFGFPRSRFRLNQFGGNVSGRIVEDKLFFFTNYEGVRQTRGQFFQALTPTAAFRASVAPAVLPLLATLPLPTEPFFPQGSTTADPNAGIYTVQKNGTLREDTGSIKIDWNQSDQSQFSARYNINDSKTVTPYGVGTDQTADGTLRVQLFKLSHNYAFSGSTVNEFAFGINRNVTNPSAGPSTLPIVNFLFGDQAIATIGPAQFNQYRTGTVYQFLDTLSFVQGNHSLKAGVDIRLNRRSAESTTQETLSFLGLVRADTLDLKNNLPFTVSKSGSPLLSYANENFSFFFQDDWKAHPRLSLNLGLRYDVSTVSREKEGRLQNFDLRTLTFTPLGQKIHKMDTNNFGPRVGFAFDVFGNQKTVVRGGYGIFYNRELPASFGSPQVNTFPTLTVGFFDAFDPNCGVLPQYPIQPNDYRCSKPNAFHIENDLETAMAQHWSLNIQQNVGIGVLEVGYVGNHVTHLLTDGVISPRNINRRDPNTNLRPLSNNFGDIFVVGDYPQSKYNALQVNFKRNLSSGFRVNANYTWAHAIDDVVGFFRDYQNEYDAKAEKASSDQDIRHNFVLDIGYDLSFSRWFGNGPKWLVDGWQFNSITQIRTGFPVNVTRSGGTFGGFSFRPSLRDNVDTRCPNYNVPNCQFNVNAFYDPGTGVFGNLGRNALRGPGFAQVDFSIGKNTRITERTALQLRMEIFNLFNKANFADPSGGLVQGDSNSLRPTAFFGQSLSTVGNQLGGLLGAGGPRQIQLSARFNF
ncbi:MAG TPA: TonB-dependent receptor [Pyrinomonadaceae bacterium]|jgi:hypothetical protein